MKKCPYCGKHIEMNAIGCPHCQRLVAPSNKWYAMKMIGHKSAEINIFGDIGQPGWFNPDAISAKLFYESLEGLGDVAELTIRINSYGGEVFDGNAIYNFLRDHKAIKTTIVEGIAASQASVIAMAGNKGKAKMRENAFLMIHKASMGVIGNSNDFARYSKLLDDIEVNAIKAYQRHAEKLSSEEIQELIDSETWLTAADAKTYGFIDEIIESVEVEEPVTNTGRAAPMNIKSILFKQQIGLQRPANKGVSMLKCKHCGKEIAEGLQFCGHCGKPTNEAPASPDFKIAVDKERAEARATAQAEERKRASEITARCDKNGITPEFRNSLIADGTPLDQSIAKILDEIEKKNPTTPVSPDAKIQKDETEKFRQHVTNSLQVALRIEKDAKVIEDVRKNPGPRDIHSLVRACLVKEGNLSRDQIDRLSAQDIANHAVRLAKPAMAGMGSSDLPYVLADTMNKEFKGGFDDEPSTFQAVCAETDNDNFMSKSMTKISSFSDIEELPEGVSFKQGKFSDKKESIQLVTYGKMLTLTRNLMVNNDTSAISMMPRAMSGAMKRTMNRTFINIITYNTLVGHLTTEDGVAFFDDTAHANLKASSGIPSISSLDEADRRLLEQPLLKSTADAATTYLSRTGSILYTGTKNRKTVLQLLGSANDPAATDGKLVENIYKGGFTPIFDPYLQSKFTAASKDYAWYWLAGPQQFRNWIVAYLSGNRTPTLRSEPSGVGEALGISYDIYFDFKFGFEDYRGVILNDGA